MPQSGWKTRRSGAVEALPLRREAGNDPEGRTAGVGSNGRSQRFDPNARARGNAADVRREGGDGGGGELLGGLRERGEPGRLRRRGRLRSAKEASRALTGCGRNEWKVVF